MRDTTYLDSLVRDAAESLRDDPKMLAPMIFAEGYGNSFKTRPTESDMVLLRRFFPGTPTTKQVLLAWRAVMDRATLRNAEEQGRSVSYLQRMADDSFRELAAQAQQWVGLDVPTKGAPLLFMGVQVDTAVRLLAGAPAWEARAIAFLNECQTKGVEVMRDRAEHPEPDATDWALLDAALGHRSPSVLGQARAAVLLRVADLAIRAGRFPISANDMAHPFHYPHPRVFVAEMQEGLTPAWAKELGAGAQQSGRHLVRVSNQIAEHVAKWGDDAHAIRRSQDLLEARTHFGLEAPEAKEVIDTITNRGAFDRAATAAALAQIAYRAVASNDDLDLDRLCAAADMVSETTAAAMVLSRQPIQGLSTS